MLIVKNLFSFYVEFEILLHFLLFCRLWNVNKNVNMRNDAWNEMYRTYTNKSSEKHLWTKIADHNNEIFSLIRSVKKVQKLRTAILKLQTAIIGAGSANLCFNSGYWLELRGFNTPSSQTSLNWLKNRSQTRKKRKHTEEELKNRARNRRSSWCTLFFTIFSCCAFV
jgi:hypothetical protein